MVIRADQFGSTSTPSGAAPEYLEMRGQRLGATTLDDIFDAVKRGGFAFNSANDDVDRGGLKVALGKDQNFRNLPIAVDLGCSRGRLRDRAAPRVC